MPGQGVLLNVSGFQVRATLSILLALLGLHSERELGRVSPQSLLHRCRDQIKVRGAAGTMTGLQSAQSMSAFFGALVNLLCWQFVGLSPGQCSGLRDLHVWGAGGPWSSLGHEACWPREPVFLIPKVLCSRVELPEGRLNESMRPLDLLGRRFWSSRHLAGC